jgi:hypothetical protein
MAGRNSASRGGRQLVAGKVRALGVASPRRLAAVPDVPTMAEAGFPELEGGPWFGLAAPAGTPRAVVDWLNTETRKAFSAPDVRERFLAQGLTLPLGTPRSTRPTSRPKASDGATSSGAPASRWSDGARPAPALPRRRSGAVRALICCAATSEISIAPRQPAPDFFRVRAQPRLRSGRAHSVEYLRPHK